MLWDLELSHFSYSAVELGGEGPDMDLSDLGTLSDFDASAILEMEVPGEVEAAGQGSEGPAMVGTARTEDFNPTLYGLEESDRAYLRGELEKELRRDLRGEVLNALFDRLEEPGRPERQLEILGVLRTLLPNFLSRGALAEAGRVIGEIEDIAARPGVLPAEASDIAASLSADLSSPEVVTELIRALENNAAARDSAELSGLLSRLRPSALTALLEGAEETRDTSTAQVLRSAVMEIAEEHPNVVIQLLGSDTAAVVAGAVRLAGRMKLAEAGDALARLLENGSKQLRKVVVETAKAVPSSVLAAALQRTLGDEDRELRVATARALGEMKYAPAADQFRQIIEDRSFRDSDVTEKVVLFEAYGSLAGDAGVSFLDKVLNGKSLFGRRQPSEIRAGAALALGKIGTKAADQSLEKAAADGDPVVRSAVGRAKQKVEAKT